MLKNYLLTALRNLSRQRTNAIINVAGLTLGIGAALTLFLLILYHNSFDTYHSKLDRIYRVVTESNGNNGKDHTAGIPAVLPEAFRTDFTEAEEVTFISYRANELITIPRGDKDPLKFEERKGVAYAQPNFFKIFDRSIVTGSAEQGLDEPNEAIISRAWAKRYFNTEDAVGEVLRFDNRDFKVTAVMEDAPVNTDLPFNLLLSYVTVKKELDDHGWNSIWSDEHCYFLLKEGESVSSIASRMPAFVKKYLGDDNRSEQTFLLQPMREVHSDERFGNFNYSTVSGQTLVMMGVLALFLLLTASINFINLSTAEAIKRSREVGIRKSLGSTRGQLVLQFLGETFLLTLVATLIALIMVQAGTGFLNSYLDVTIALALDNPVIWLTVLGVVLLTSLLSGLYPSFVVSGFSPAAALKNSINARDASGYWLRRMLVVFQFFISQLLIMGTIVFLSQMDFFLHKDLGFRRDAIITVPVPASEEPAKEAPSKMRTLREQIQGLAAVESASLNGAPPSSGSVSGTALQMEGSDQFLEVQVKTVDGNYIPLFDLPVVAGNNLEDQDTARGFVVNEKLAKMAGFQNPTEILGKRINMWGKRLPVVGVVRDFHTVSLRHPIEPTILLNRIRGFRSLSIRMKGGDPQETIAAVQQLWEKTYPEYIFSYEYLDESIANFYENERRTSTLLSLFTGLAIFIGCLGLFGLASFMANQKTKEIGIRKALGASVENILMIFTREFAGLIIVGYALALPAAWLGLNSYLSDFTYRIDLQPWMFLVGLLTTALVAALTVGYRSLRAAVANPVNSLRSE